jgi:hypothetical protein
MPITKTTGYLASDGVVYPTYEEARKAELLKLFTPASGCELTPEICVDWVLNNAADVVQWLTTGPTSRPGARKKAGTTAPKRAARRATEAQVASGIKAMREAVEAAPQATEQTA